MEDDYHHPFSPLKHEIRIDEDLRINGDKVCGAVVIVTQIYLVLYCYMHQLILINHTVEEMKAMFVSMFQRVCDRQKLIIPPNRTRWTPERDRTFTDRPQRWLNASLGLY